ncbi:MAG: AI-2E family transporter [Burkholderiaceae bacterium]
MTDDRLRPVCNLAFSLAVIALAAWVVHDFLLPLGWAAILAIATWPIYLRLRVLLGGRATLAALLLTLLIGAAVVAPSAWLIDRLRQEAPGMIEWLRAANRDGIGVPGWIPALPLVGATIANWWRDTLAQPNGLADLLSGDLAARLHGAGDLLRLAGSQLLHRLVDLLFALVALFFFYLNGPMLTQHLTRHGAAALGPLRWARYAGTVPPALRATFVGFFAVAAAEGVLIGISYLLAGVPSPVIWGVLTGAVAVIPFAAPIAFGAAAALLAVQGHMTAALAVAAWGMLVLFVADHFVRPVIIGSATRMPFLAVLFGILGGIQVFGLLGLFAGPLVMVMFLAWWNEPAP